MRRMKRLPSGTGMWAQPCSVKLEDGERWTPPLTLLRWQDLRGSLGAAWLRRRAEAAAQIITRTRSAYCAIWLLPPGTFGRRSHLRVRSQLCLDSRDFFVRCEALTSHFFCCPCIFSSQQWHSWPRRCRLLWCSPSRPSCSDDLSTPRLRQKMCGQG